MNVASRLSNSLQRRLLGAGILAALLLTLTMAGCSNTPQAGPPKRVEVVVTTPIVDPEVVDYQDFTGRLDAVKTVNIVARVTGYLNEVTFREGDVVHEGDVLFQIDPRPFEADVNQAEANLKVAEADANLLLKNADRARKLIGGPGIAREDYDTAVAAQAKGEQTVGSMKAALKKARLYLEYSTVTAPVTGRISRRFVDPGNDVTADVTQLTTIVTEDPIYAYFDVDERTYLDLKGSASPTQHTWFSGFQLPVTMRLANEDNFSRKGSVNFIDNMINGTTGTIRMRGVFDNPTGELKKGLFVRIRLPVSKPYQAVLVPDEALMTDQGRKNILVVKEKKTPDGADVKDDNGKPIYVVEYRQVETGMAIDKLRVIKKGLDASEGVKVVISGQQRVRLNSKEPPEVVVKEQAPPAVPKSTLGTLFEKSK